jgi:hypothetical protein
METDCVFCISPLSNIIDGRYELGDLLRSFRKGLVTPSLISITVSSFYLNKMSSRSKQRTTSIGWTYFRLMFSSFQRWQSPLFFTGSATSVSRDSFPVRLLRMVDVLMERSG